jgi:hypothetical protein
VKNLAKLALFFSISFAIFFIVAAGLRFISLMVEWASSIPQKDEFILSQLIAASQWALSFTLYVSLLLGLCYAARNHAFAPATIICLITLSLCFTFGVSAALDHLKDMPPAKSSGKPLGGSGLILSNSLNKNETAIILLNGAEDALGPRVVATPERPLLYQEAAVAGFDLPPVPFRNDTPWFLKSISIDLRLNSEIIKQRCLEGYMSFLIYAGALVFVLTSLGFVVKFSAWPLANLFLGILAFRGILALEQFFNSPEMQYMISSFLNNMLPVTLIVPVIFFGFGLLIHIYSFLVYITKKRSYDDE